MCKVNIGHGLSQQIVLKILSRTYPDATDRWDGNWLNSIVEISLGSFSGSYQALLRSDEIKDFHDGLVKLEKTLEGIAEYKSMEDWLSIRITNTDSLGHFKIDFVARDNQATSAQLSGTIAIDQSYFKKILNELQKILEQFSVR